jgi:hypothetical protein
MAPLTIAASEFSKLLKSTLTPLPVAAAQLTGQALLSHDGPTAVMCLRRPG